MSKDWQEGYKAGFEDGFEKGKKMNTPPSNPYMPISNNYISNPYAVKPMTTTCHVCGITFEPGKVYGYVCNNARCPSKVYCGTTAVSINPYTASASSWTTGRPTSNLMYSVNSVPDGLSYEEIYGSVVYQQNRKETND